MKLGRAAVLLVSFIAAGLTAGAAQTEVIDGVGRHVRVPVAPRRVVALAPSVTETIYSIGAGASVVGVTDFTDWPAEATKLPSVGGLLNPSIEQLVALRPDLVIATRDANRRETIDELDRLGIPAFVVSPQGLDGVIEAVRQIGRVLNRAVDADRLADGLRSRREAVIARVRGLPQPRVLLVIWPDPVMTIGRHAFITDVLGAAGARSVSDDLLEDWPRISLEEVIRRNPDLILLPTRGHQPISVADLQHRPGWDRVEAVRQSRVMYYDERLDHSSPLVFDVLEEMAKKFHPQAFR